MPSRNELKLMRNEIFARYGYKFEPNGRMDKHFTEKPWYLPEHEDVTPFLTNIEVQNVNQIKSTEIEVLEAVQFLKVSQTSSNEFIDKVCFNFIFNWFFIWPKKERNLLFYHERSFIIQKPN